MDELERLLPTFRTEIANVYAEAAHSGAIPSGRRAYVLGRVAALRSRYAAKLQTLKASQPADAVDAVERQLMRIENIYAARLTNAA